MIKINRNFLLPRFLWLFPLFSVVTLFHAVQAQTRSDMQSDWFSFQDTPVISASESSNPPKATEGWYQKLNIRGYAQFRYNYLTHLADGSTPPQHAGDGSISDNQQFLIRRARVIFFGDISDHLYVYMQPGFASLPDVATSGIQFTQIRDWYGDVYFDRTKVHRLRIGQSKVPYGRENLQSSQNRLYLCCNQ